MNSLIDLTVRYGGLRGRTLKAAGRGFFPLPTVNKNDIEDQSIVSVSFRLSALESEIVGLVEQLCEPLFVLFNFAKLQNSTYERIVGDFAAGKVGQ